MKVPGTPGPMAQGAPQEQIPDAYLMMAAAQMAKEQQTKLAGDVVPIGPALREKTWEGVKNDPTYVQKRYTKELLNRVLGGGAKVLPMTPGDKE